MLNDRASVAVIGSGPAGLMAAEVLAKGGARVTLFDGMPSPGRKFLLAGRGGLNLTHSEDRERFIARYGAASARLGSALMGFPPDEVRRWCRGLGQETFVGTSGRVFPAAFKASPLLRAWLRRLDGLGVTLRPRHRWTGWGDDGALMFATPDGFVAVRPEATVLALGGASWPRLGADGAWTAILHRDGIDVRALVPANCGFLVDWSPVFRERFEGAPLKGVALAFGRDSIRGEATVTRTGLEGGGIYAWSAPLRDAIAAEGTAILTIDLKPDLAPDLAASRIGAARRGGASIGNLLRKALKLSPVAVGLLQEAAHATRRPLGAMADAEIATLVRAVPVRLAGTAPIERAISSAGGLAWEAIDDTFMLRGRPGTFAAGEMIDWEAPTGGYLLQACFATGAAAGAGALAWLERARFAHQGDEMPPRAPGVHRS